MGFWFLLLAQIVPICVLVYFYVYQKHNYWSKRGVNGPKPLPFVGNLLDIFRRGQTATELEWFAKYGKVYVIYTGGKLILVVNDPELIKQVAIKDFNVFTNRHKTLNSDEIAKQNLFNSEGGDWKRIRTITSPTFTSGKLKGMYPLMSHCVNKLANYFDKLSTNGDGVINTKEVIAGFTIDVIASTSFGTETNTNDDRSVQNPFLYHGLRVFGNRVRFLANLLLPRSIGKLVHALFPPVHMYFFINLARQVVKQRREANCKRNDFVQLFMDAYVEESELENANFDSLTAPAAKVDDDHKSCDVSNHKIVKTLNDGEIMAQCLIFFTAGFETTASAISHCIFELAQNPEIQERLVQKLNEALDGLDENSEQYYEIVTSKIPYLDAAIKETLRLYPPLTKIDRRVVVNDYKLAGITLEKNQQVSLGTYIMHHNTTSTIPNLNDSIQTDSCLRTNIY